MFIPSLVLSLAPVVPSVHAPSNQSLAADLQFPRSPEVLEEQLLKALLAQEPQPVADPASVTKLPFDPTTDLIEEMKDILFDLAMYDMDYRDFVERKFVALNKAQAPLAEDMKAASYDVGQQLGYPGQPQILSFYSKPDSNGVFSTIRIEGGYSGTISNLILVPYFEDGIDLNDYPPEFASILATTMPNNNEPFVYSMWVNGTERHTGVAIRTTIGSNVKLSFQPYSLPGDAPVNGTELAAFQALFSLPGFDSWELVVEALLPAYELPTHPPLGQGGGSARAFELTPDVLACIEAALQAYRDQLRQINEWMKEDLAELERRKKQAWDDFKRNLIEVFVNFPLGSELQFEMLDMVLYERARDIEELEIQENNIYEQAELRIQAAAQQLRDDVMDCLRDCPPEVQAMVLEMLEGWIACI